MISCNNPKELLTGGNLLPNKDKNDSMFWHQSHWNVVSTELIYRSCTDFESKGEFLSFSFAASNKPPLPTSTNQAKTFATSVREASRTSLNATGLPIDVSDGRTNQTGQSRTSHHLLGVHPPPGSQQPVLPQSNPLEMPVNLNSPKTVQRSNLSPQQPSHEGEGIDEGGIPQVPSATVRAPKPLCPIHQMTATMLRALSKDRWASPGPERTRDWGCLLKDLAARVPPLRVTPSFPIARSYFKK